MWEKYCRYEGEKEWARHELYSENAVGDRKRAHVGFVGPGGREIKVCAKLISWPALFFGPFWVLFKRAWLLALILMIPYVLLWAVGASSHLYLLHIFLALAGNRCLALYFQHRGYDCLGVLIRHTRSTRGHADIDRWYSYEKDGWKYTQDQEYREMQREKESKQESKQREFFLRSRRRKP